LVVLAEGVETPIQLQRIAELGCDLYQGYLMSRPTRADRVDFRRQVSSDEGSETSPPAPVEASSEHR
jgi:EAL domain-containing protein (putative c-di-GMP-specific phosphodiesterase class I)